MNAAISSLVLPSSFRPVADPASPTGSRWVLDPTLLVSAEVTNDNPFTVTYKIRPEAQWTDNAPIAADDYWYLWRQMVSQPGVVDPAGYDLITGVQSIEGGKTAVVTFSQPYPAWRELFNDILPAHIVKDVPGGFAAGLVRALPVTGGQFRVENIDPQREEILLARNDRYWAAPAKPDQCCSAGRVRPAALADSIRNGDTQVAQVHGGAAAFAQLSAIPDVRTARIVTPRVMQLTLRAQQPKLADSQVRKAILGLLDVDLLAAVGAGSDNTVTLAQAQVRSPSDPGYVPTAPPAMTKEAALELLAQTAATRCRPSRRRRRPRPAPRCRTTTAAGSPRTVCRCRWCSVWRPMIRHPWRSPTPRPTSCATSASRRRCWGWILLRSTATRSRRTGSTRSSAGIRPAATSPRRWHRATAAGRWRRRRCRPPLPARPRRQRRRPTPSDQPRSAAPDRAPRRRHRRRPARRRNRMSWCRRRVTSPASAIAASSPRSTRRCDGTENIGEVIDAVEPRLWNMSTVLPILQDTTIVAAGPSVQNVSLSGAVPVGIVGDAGRWAKAPQ